MVPMQRIRPWIEAQAQQQGVIDFVERVGISSTTFYSLLEKEWVMFNLVDRVFCKLDVFWPNLFPEEYQGAILVDRDSHGNEKREKNFNLRKGICRECGDPFECPTTVSVKKFCSKRCSTTFHKRRYRKRHGRSDKGRQAHTHCVHGHEFTPENTGRRRDGFRTCLACRRERDRKQKRKERAVGKR
jgi:hypothetical protein